MRQQPKHGMKISNTKVMVKRSMRHAVRSKDTIITAIIMPIFMMLFFVYVFGGSINTGSVKYIDIVVPGIVLMSVSLGTSYAAMRLSTDLTNGIVNRFRSMPIARSSILNGHVVTSVLFNMVSAAVVLVVAFLIGFRTNASLTTQAKPRAAQSSAKLKPTGPAPMITSGCRCTRPLRCASLCT